MEKMSIGKQVTKDDITIVMKKHHYNFAYYKGEGYDVQVPLRGNGKMVRAVRYLWIKLHLPFAGIWVNKKYDSSKPYAIVYEGVGVELFVEWLHKHHPEVKIHFYVNNPVAVCDTDLSKIYQFCTLWSADVGDCALYAEKYGLRHSFFGYEKNMFRPQRESEYDAVFIGKDKGRAQDVLDLKNTLESIGKKVYVRICADNTKSPSKPYYQPPLPYEEYVDIESRSFAIIDVLQQGQTMTTMRAREALVNRKKLITNNANIVNEPFYRANNIFLLGKDDISKLNDFFNTPFEPLDEQLMDSLWQQNIFLANIQKVNAENHIGDGV